MPYTRRDQTIALAAVFQAAQLVQQLASTGNLDQDDLATCLQSLFAIDVETAEDAYGGAHKLQRGLRSLIEQFGSREPLAHAPRDMNITKYVAGVLVLERRLMKNPAMLKQIREGLERAQHQLKHFSLTHDNVLAGLAHLYTQTISTLKPRIMVQGEHLHLSNESTANRIRALLLSAIRAAVLWRQCGGSRWQLFFSRRAIVDEARAILKAS